MTLNPCQKRGVMFVRSFEKISNTIQFLALGLKNEERIAMVLPFYGSKRFETQRTYFDHFQNEVCPHTSIIVVTHYLGDR